ncbi:MAG: hypothetical protein WBG86_04465 [Polyangiales bacterium]
MKTTQDAVRGSVVALFLASSLFAGCGDTESDDFSAECALCVNGAPVGPSSDEASCTTWGSTFDCTESTLSVGCDLGQR